MRRDKVCHAHRHLCDPALVDNKTCGHPSRRSPRSRLRSLSRPCLLLRPEYSCAARFRPRWLGCALDRYLPNPNFVSRADLLLPARVSPKKIPGGITLKFESGNLQKLVALSSLSCIIQFLFSSVFAAEMWVIRVVSFEATSGQISFETAILDSSGVTLSSSQISSSGHLMVAALKEELVACGLIYALSSVSGLTAVALETHGPHEQLRVFSRLVCAGKLAGTSEFQGILRLQEAKVVKIQPSLVTVTSITAVSATSIKTASTSGTVISRRLVWKIVTDLHQAVVFSRLDLHHL